MNTIITLIEQYPKLVSATTLLFMLSYSYLGSWTLLAAICYYSLILFGLLTVNSLLQVVSRWRAKDESTEYRDQVRFFSSRSELYSSARNQKSSRQFPLASTHHWKAWHKSREDEAKIPTRSEYMPSTEMQEVMDQLVSFICRDFIKSWYQHISSDVVWVSRTESLIHSLIAELTYRFRKVDLVQFTVSRILPLVISHIQNFKQAESLVRAGSKLAAGSDPNLDELLLAKHYRMGKLHPAVTGPNIDTKNQECQYLRKTVQRLIPLILSKAECSSALVTIFLREVLSSLLLQPTFDSFSDPDFINQSLGMAIDQLSEQVQPEYHQLILGTCKA